ncbi:polysaccharide pyruvyl transferase family protein [Georgenia muralis]|nr:polysaccharide pyruvyl transferase family protein [Georgenia muralis]
MHPNFGDEMTPWLLPHFGIAPVHRAPSRARLVGVGSILEHLPTDFAGVVWGSGLIDDRPRPLPNATVVAVRGALTREHLGVPSTTVLGDPALLVSRLIPRPRVRWRLGLVPHGHHRDHPNFLAPAKNFPAEVRVINVHDRPARTVRRIAACDAILTTSLHGLVVADAYGIPAAWTVLQPALSGGDFKFRDYETVVTPSATRRYDFRPGETLTQLAARTRRADAAAVAVAMQGLDASVGTLHDIFAGEVRRPFSAAVDLLSASASRRGPS